MIRRFPLQGIAFFYMNTEFEHQINTVVDNYFTKKLVEIDETIKSFEGKNIGCEALDVVREANSWLKTYAEMNQQPGLYEAYRYHVFIVNNTFMILQGKEEDTSPRKGMP